MRDGPSYTAEKYFHFRRQAGRQEKLLLQTKLRKAEDRIRHE
jgi:hypothetical protein